jgi:hypothetical protein
MTSEQEHEARRNEIPLQPLELMGWFWAMFGLVVLSATAFVEENEYVPLARGIATNVAASLILIGAGAFSIRRGRKARRRLRAEAEGEGGRSC